MFFSFVQETFTKFCMEFFCLSIAFIQRTVLTEDIFMFFVFISAICMNCLDKVCLSIIWCGALFINTFSLYKYIFELMRLRAESRRKKFYWKVSEWGRRALLSMTNFCLNIFRLNRSSFGLNAEHITLQPFCSLEIAYFFTSINYPINPSNLLFSSFK